MLIAKEKSPKTSMKCQAEARKAAQGSTKRVPSPSAAQLAEESCAEMIQNLEKNIAGRTTRSVL